MSGEAAALTIGALFGLYFGFMWWLFGSPLDAALCTLACAAGTFIGAAIGGVFRR
jgi:hypothetical protein